MANKPLTHGRLTSLLDFDPKTGLFRWKQRRNQHAEAGSVAGQVDGRGYVIVTIDGIRYQGHWLAWFFVRKEWPKEGLDHIDFSPTNNAIDNLREASKTQNNRHRNPKSDYVSGFVGVCWHSQSSKWRAYITVNHKQRSLGLYSTIEDAAVARRAAVLQTGGFYLV